jgi:hypothetical protein
MSERTGLAFARTHSHVRVDRIKIKNKKTFLYIHVDVGPRLLQQAPIRADVLGSARTGLVGADAGPVRAYPLRSARTWQFILLVIFKTDATVRLSHGRPNSHRPRPHLSIRSLDNPGLDPIMGSKFGIGGAGIRVVSAGFGDD